MVFNPNDPQQQSMTGLRSSGDTTQQQLNQLDAPRIVGLGAVNPYSLESNTPPTSMASQSNGEIDRSIPPTATPMAATLAAANAVPTINTPTPNITTDAMNDSPEKKKQPSALPGQFMTMAGEQLHNSQEMEMSAYNTIFGMNVSHSSGPLALPSNVSATPIQATVGQQTPMLAMSDRNQKKNIKPANALVYQFLNAIYREKNGR